MLATEATGDANISRAESVSSSIGCLFFVFLDYRHVWALYPIIDMYGPPNTYKHDPPMLLVYVACPDADIYHMKRPRFELVPKVTFKNGRFWIFRTR